MNDTRKMIEDWRQLEAGAAYTSAPDADDAAYRVQTIRTPNVEGDHTFSFTGLDSTREVLRVSMAMMVSWLAGHPQSSIEDRACCRLLLDRGVARGYLSLTERDMLETRVALARGDS